MNRNRDSALTRIVGWTTVALMAAFTIITAIQIGLTPTNPGWYAMAWAFLGLAAMVIGHLLGGLPRSAGANGLMLIIYVLGFLVVPLVTDFVVHWNVAVGLVATPFAVGFALAAKYYWRIVEAQWNTSKASGRRRVH